MIERSPTNVRRRQLLLVGAGLAGLLAGLLALYALFDQGDPVAIAPRPVPAADPRALKPAPPPVLAEPVPAVPAGRSPFSQLVVPAQLIPGDPPADAGAVAADGGGEPASSSGGQAQDQPALAPAEERAAQRAPSRLESPVPPPQDEAAVGADPPGEPLPPPVPDPAISWPPVTTPVTIPAPPEAPIFLNDSLWKTLLGSFQWLRLVAVHDGGTGEAHAWVDVAGRVHTLTVDQAVGPYMVEHIAGRCIEVSAAYGPGTRALLRTCTPPSGNEGLPPITTAANGGCVELRSDLSFSPSPPPALLERRVFLCRNTTDVPTES